jgi:hypothetical protein
MERRPIQILTKGQFIAPQFDSNAVGQDYGKHQKSEKHHFVRERRAFLIYIQTYMKPLSNDFV